MGNSHPSKNPTAAAGIHPHPGRTLAAALDAWLAAPMWAVTVLWMICLAGALQELREAPTLPLGTSLYYWGMLLLWPAYLLELAAHAMLGSPNLRFNILYLLAPPLRLGGRDHATWREIWLPGAGWQRVNRELLSRVEKALSRPMVGFALLVLPLLAIQWKWKDQVEDYVWLHFSWQTASSVIWLAFTLDLIVMASIARRKVRYLTKHWIDVLIVVLPMVEAMPALRLAALARLQYLSKLSNISRVYAPVYRTRGLAMRAYRALLLLESVQRLLRLNPERRLAALRETLEDRHHEIELIQREMRELEARIAAERLADARAECAVTECEPAE